MSPTGIDSAPCTREAPCQTFARAYRAAGPGDVVELAAGTYTADVQSIPFDPTKRRGDPIIFRPADGAAVTIAGQVRVAATRIFFRDMRFASGWVATGDRITFKNIDSAGMFILSGTNISVLGGQVYPGPGYQGEQDADPLLASGTRGNPPTNILIDGVRFHGWLRPPGSNYHTECFQAGAGVNVVIRNSRFYDCATHDLFIQSWGTLNNANNRIDNWVLENNYLGATRDGYFSVQLLNRDDQTQPGARFVIRNNSWLPGNPDRPARRREPEHHRERRRARAESLLPVEGRDRLGVQRVHRCSLLGHRHAGAVQLRQPGRARPATEARRDGPRPRRPEELPAHRHPRRQAPHRPEARRRGGGGEVSEAAEPVRQDYGRSARTRSKNAASSRASREYS